MTGHGPHGLEHKGVAHAARLDLLADHGDASAAIGVVSLLFFGRRRRWGLWEGGCIAARRENQEKSRERRRGAG